MIEIIQIQLFDNKKGNFARSFAPKQPFSSLEDLEKLRLRMQRRFKNKYGIYFCYKKKVDKLKIY